MREKKNWKAKAIKGKRVSFPDLKRGNIAGGEDETDFMCCSVRLVWPIGKCKKR